jgi:hypothetical protein
VKLMQPSIPTGPDNSSIEDLRFEKQALEKLVGEQRERIAALESTVKPERKGLWGRVFGSLAVLVLGIGFAQPLLAEYETGNSWLSKEENNGTTGRAYQLGYVAGAVDSFALVTALEKHDFDWIAECGPGQIQASGGWTLGQLRAVLEKYYADNPERRHYIAAGELYNALTEVCL